MISKMWLIPVVVFLGGATCIAAAVATGQAEVDLVVVFPVFSGSSGLFLLGIGLILLSFLVGFVMLAILQGSMMVMASDGGRARGPMVEKKTRYGGVVLVGPVPIAFGPNKKIAIVMLVLGIAMAVALISMLLMLG